MTLRVMVTGSRGWTDPTLIDHYLRHLLPSIVIHGAAPGLDTLAGIWATSRGIPVRRIWAEWRECSGCGARANTDDHIIHARVCLLPGSFKRPEAGPERNGWLLDEKPDIVVGFPMPDSRGTWNALRQAEERGIPRIIVQEGLR